MADFLKEIEQLINKHSIENASNTPDYILANFMCGCLEKFEHAIRLRKIWYSRKPQTKESLNSAVIALDDLMSILESHCDSMTDDQFDGMKQELEEMAQNLVLTEKTTK